MTPLMEGTLAQQDISLSSNCHHTVAYIKEMPSALFIPPVVDVGGLGVEGQALMKNEDKERV